MKSLFLVSYENDVFNEYSGHEKPIQFVTFKLKWFTNQLLLTANIVKYFPLTARQLAKCKHSHEVANSQKCLSLLQQYPILRGLKTQYNTVGFNKRALR